MLTKNELININKFAQDKLDYEFLQNWYDGLSDERQKEVINDIWYLICQAHPEKETIDKGIYFSKVKPNANACVKIKNPNKPFEKYGWEIKELDPIERRKGFKVFIYIFKVADTQRRQTEKTCNHWWHNLD